MGNNVTLIIMNAAQTKLVRWLWKPYIPYGKITLVQGDPGDGKTTLVLAITALLTMGKPMPESEPVPLGEYRGFDMTLSFETFAKEYRVTLSGALSHTVALGSDIHGNITRFDNRLDGLGDSLRNCENSLADTQTQMKAAQGEVTRPFAQEQEYLTKSMRFRELNSLLNMDEKDNTILDYEQDEGDTDHAPKVVGMER